MIFRRFLFFLFVLGTFLQGYAQTDSLTAPKDTVAQYRRSYTYVRLDSAQLAQAKHVRDSLTWMFVAPDPKRENLFVKEMLEKHIVHDHTFLHQGPKQIKKEEYKEGKLVVKYPTWEILVLIFLIICFAILRLVFGKKMSLIFQAFYDDRTFSQINKEENILSSWYFLFSYVLYSFFIGLFAYVALDRYGVPSDLKGFNLFLFVSVFFGLALAIKILGLRLLGHFFNVQKITREYVNSIYLSFFNASLLFIPLVIFFTLSVNSNIWFLWGGIAFLCLSFVLQLFRVGINILSRYKLSKFYLFLYLCTFELCPIIILIKALNI
ncbi:hypothetical protein Pedsa_2524 [Pseudopedobacter saltans DSM 12145]|uniref:DUF4271 domain-containing protein n=1 Tax=Pseudopedobacter saltans (strain ATCC 51119 / DSM 12145 / JCM 21818 / CCUG 39354 / LMG 10337 / NBRC 100064 / NCIMB 13643) TaxID=762903 RepID=F0S4Q1_PSESL|nr:DUF4271 domain-containing protein [Pseudopedobacter saltans]ADY53069.1 hypothetical protein Pedsa_2524 [Pseudopedobacter saltans DSM 12145]